MPSVEGNLSFCSRINFTSIQKESASKFGTTQTIYRYVNLKTDKFDLTCTPDHKFYYRKTNSHWAKAANLENKELQREFVLKSKEKILNQLSINSMIMKYETLFSQILSKNITINAGAKENKNESIN